MALEPVEESQERADGNAREEERDTQAQRIEREQRRAFPGRLAAGRDRQDRSKHRPMQARPPDGESEAQEKAAQRAGGDAGTIVTQQPVKQTDAVDAEEVQPMAMMSTPAIGVRIGSNCRNAWPKAVAVAPSAMKTNREAEDEEERGDRRPPLQRPGRAPPRCATARSWPRSYSEVGRHERQHAGAQEAQNTGADDQRQGDFHGVTLLRAPY